MYFNKETLWKLRQQVVVNSLFLNDYKNDFVDKEKAFTIFDSYLTFISEEIYFDSDTYAGLEFMDIFKKYFDNADALWTWYNDNDVEYYLDEIGAFKKVYMED